VLSICPGRERGAAQAAGRACLSLVMQLWNCPVPERGKATAGAKIGSEKILLARARLKVIPTGRGGAKGWQKSKVPSSGYRRLTWDTHKENWGFP